MCLCRSLLAPLALAAWACSDPAPKPASAVASAADAQADAQVGDVAGLVDIVLPDTGPTASSCPGSPGCACASNEACQSGVCADDGQSKTGKACAYPFGAGCVPGYVAFTADTGEGATVCVPAAPKLCNPCEKDDDCKATGGTGALCVEHGATGRFCGIACPAAGCPKGYVCADATAVSGAKSKQCQASEQPPPTCSCSPAASAHQLSTPCLVQNTAGSCGGVRVCGAGGLSACSGKVPAPESCNGQDDDCNGQTDEGPVCDDGDGCTVGDGCVAGACKPGVVKVCEDGDLCTVGEVCVGGSCGVGKVVACDGGQCNVGTCDKATGKCAFATKGSGAACDDGNACTLGDACSGAVCLGQPKVCDDKDGCTLDSCTVSGDCTAVVAQDGKACDDGYACTTGESCQGGACSGGTKAAPCGCVANGDCVDDGLVCNGVPYCDKSAAVWACKVNPATVVSCPMVSAQCKASECKEPAATCGEVALPDGSTCSDGVVLTVGDVCEAGVCKGTGVQLCKGTADCAKYEDGDLCNGTLFCNKAIGSCVVNPATVVVCPTADDTPCRTNVCAAKSGACVLTAVNELKACEDGNLCTIGEACKGGVCTATAGGDTCVCKTDADCGKFEDGDGCNGTLFCNLGKQKCEVNPNSVVVCPSANDGPCATNVCIKASGTCAMQATAGKVGCDADGNPCTPVDLCVGGKCVADTTNVCQCQQDSDCADDGDLCNGVPYCDKANNVCIPNPKTVVACELAGDSTCAVTACVPATGNCVKTNTSLPCSDGDACTVGDVCAGGSCKPGDDTCGSCKSHADCDDKDVCTDDVCGGKPTVCSHTFNTAPCSDGDACTTGDGCAGGKCAGKALDCEDSETCTADTCKGGSCVYLADNTATCTDGDACSVGDYCLLKNCKSGKTLNCDDGTVCTADSCDAFKGCIHAPVVASCDDGNACTVNDTCTAGKCGGPAKVCEDNNGCTTDGCDPGSGCVNAANKVPCMDGNMCTVGDACGGGVCLAGPATSCNDDNGCTVENCNSSKGCVVLPGGGTCTDGNACTLGDGCLGGQCLPGAVTACDDGNGCTADNCDAVKGCVAVKFADGATCSDGNPWTIGDLCQAGVCKAGGAAAAVAVGCPPTGSGASCANGMGTCANGLCQSTDAQGYKWTLVPAGKFWMGCNAAVDGECTGNAEEKPQHEVDLSAYWIGVYEVTAEGYKKCVTANASGCTPPAQGGGTASTYGTTGKEQHPVVKVNWPQAQAVCKWLGGDLPTEAQWEKAARGGCEVYAGKDCKSSAVKYPWGNTEPLCAQHAAFYTGTGACGQATVLQAVGAASTQGASPYGAYDMAGNVWEWTMDWYDGSFYAKAAATNKDAWNSTSANMRVGRGGSYSNAALNLRTGWRGYYETSGVPADIGVRCAKPMLETLCDNKDDNANGQTDEGCDDDKDGYCEVAMAVVGTPPVCAKGGGDCDDGKAGINLGASEVCGNGVDDNCAVGVDEGCPIAGMVLIPAGTFWMGCNATKDPACSGNANENPQHKVTLSAYYMDITEVTVAEYKKCFDAGKCGEPGGAGSGYCNWDTAAKKAKSGRDQHPVNCVNWAESQNYCKWRGGQVDTANAGKYDLPTEAQWEMAARGSCEKNGSTAGNDAGCKAAMRTYPWGEPTATCTYAVMNGGDIGCGANATSAVGGKSAGDSPYGLKDMAGNVYEWTRDWYSATYYAGSPATDPENTVSAAYRVIRGGSFYFFASEVRAGYRYGPIPTGIEQLIGLRCSRSYP